MGISRKFLKLVKFIKFIPKGCLRIKVGRIFYFITVLSFSTIPDFTKAQNNPADKITVVNGVKYYKHIVGKDETIYGVAQKFNLQPKDIILENPFAIDGIHPGDILMIPVITRIADTSGAAKVQQGYYVNHEIEGKETLYSLSKKYHTSVSAIDSMNPGLALNGLQKGETIRIPVTPTKRTAANKVQQSHSSVKDTLQPKQPQQANTTPGKNETQAYRSLIMQQAHPETSKLLISTVDTGKKLSRYNVALIMPFTAGGPDTLRLSSLLEGSEQVPFITRVSVDFYHGLALAFDSLAKKGLKANLYVYNILTSPDSSSRSIDSILRNPQMLRMNLIIGPPHPSNFRRVAQFAAVHHIPAVSPLSSESSLLKNNPWTSKTTPSAITETNAEAEYIASQYNHANVIVIHNKDADNAYYKVFEKRFKKADSAFGNTDTLRHAESAGGVSSLAGKTKKIEANIIVIPYEETSFMTKFVNELANSDYAENDSLVMFGMHNWADNDALDAANLDTVNFHFPSNEFVDYNDVSTKKFIAKYRNVYLSEPGYYSYEGYDEGMFYGNLLQAYGTDLQNHLGDTKYKGLQTSFNMFRNNPANGYENIAVYILEYKNYTEKLDVR